MKHVDVYPVKVLEELSSYLNSRPYQTLAVLPSGSHLYNTSIPGRSVHDYDFTVFSEPHASLTKKSKQYITGDIDVKVVSVTNLKDLVRRSTELSEACFALQNDEELVRIEDDKWTPYLRSFRPSIIEYYDLIDDCIKSHEYEEPVSMNDKVAFKNFKHTVRWSLYQQRWSEFDARKGFDPKLSDEERLKFLKAIRAGRLFSILES